jgi:uncharacterized repeat protein (TIGR02543 family)
LLLFVCLVVFQIGCWHKDSKNPVAVAPASNMVSNVLFKIVMPPRQNASFSASIVSAVENQPLISFQLKLANFDNPSTPFSIIKKQFPVQNGVATITFESLPATTVVGTLQITNGNIDGYANFHGAADLNQETNIVELAPVGSLMPQDVVANSVSEIVSSTTLLLDAPRSLATELTSIVSSLPLDSNDVYDEVINNFTNRTGIPLVELTAPGNNSTFYVDDIINIVASATDLDGNISSVEFYKNSTKINETNSSPFSFAWQPKATGTYDLWTKVIDNNSAVGVSAPITVNVISAPAYAVTYDGNGNSGGTVPTDNQSYQQNATVTVTDNTGGLTKTGYSFAGWNTAADGSGTDYNPGSTFSMGTENVTLYAQWSKNPTQVSGIISADTTWSIASSPYELTNKVQIANGSTLTIEPGVFVNGNTQAIEVFGTLKAIGNLNNRITLQSTRIVPGSQESSFSFFIDLDYLNFSGELYAPTGNAVYGSINLRNSILSISREVYLWYPKSDCIIEQNVFKNFAGFSIGTHDDIKVYIQNNVFFGTAVEVWASYESSETIVRYNSFLGGGKTLVIPTGYSGSGANMTAIDNFWDTTDPNAIALMIFDQNDDLGSQNIIEFEPFLSAPHQDTPDPTPYL